MKSPKIQEIWEKSRFYLFATAAYEHVGQVVEASDINSLPEDEKTDQKLVRKRASELGEQLGKTFI